MPWERQSTNWRLKSSPRRELLAQFSAEVLTPRIAPPNRIYANVHLLVALVQPNCLTLYSSRSQSRSIGLNLGPGLFRRKTPIFHCAYNTGSLALQQPSKRHPGEDDYFCGYYEGVTIRDLSREDVPECLRANPIRSDCLAEGGPASKSRQRCSFLMPGSLLEQLQKELLQSIIAARQSRGSAAS